MSPDLKNGFSREKDDTCTNQSNKIYIGKHDPKQIETLATQIQVRVKIYVNLGPLFLISVHRTDLAFVRPDGAGGIAESSTSITPTNWLDPNQCIKFDGSSALTLDPWPTFCSSFHQEPSSQLIFPKNPSAEFHSPKDTASLHRTANNCQLLATIFWLSVVEISALE